MKVTIVAEDEGHKDTYVFETPAKYGDILRYVADLCDQED